MDIFVLTVREQTFIPLLSFILASDNGRLSESAKESAQVCPRNKIALKYSFIYGVSPFFDLPLYVK